jgi:transcriptional regulator
MYLRPVHAEHDIPTLRQLIQETQQGILITAFDPSLTTATFSSVPLTKTSNAPNTRIHTTHLPWVLHLDEPSDMEELGTLRGHIARQNPQAKILLDLARNPDIPKDERGYLEEEITVIFTSPANHYISPSYYVESKPKDGKVVPTWNYASVAAYGKIRVHAPGSSETSDYLDNQIDTLTNESESRSGPHRTDGRHAWQVKDAPEGYIGVLKKAILGVEVEIHRLEGKWKMSQESGTVDREGVVNGLRSLGRDGNVDGDAEQHTRAEQVSCLVQQRSDGKR